MTEHPVAFVSVKLSPVARTQAFRVVDAAPPLAKQQELSLNPSKLSGLCGRLNVASATSRRTARA